MSMPHIPDVNPKVTLNRNDAINLLLASIAFEELGLAHILNAEGEKIQAAIEQDAAIWELLAINKSVRKTLRGVIQKNMLLQFKLEDVAELIDRCESAHRAPDCAEE